MGRVATLVCLLLPPSVVADGPLRVGAAVADITPPAGYRMAGSYREVLATGVNDPLYAKALYFEQGDARFVLVVCDVCGLDRAMVKAIRDRIAAGLGVPADHICVSATHTHGGPMHYDPVFVELFGNPDRHHLGDYPKRFIDGCVTAATDAKAAARPAALEAGVGSVPGLAFNRRYHMKDGTVRFNPGKRNPGVVRPAGPTDDRLPVVLVKDAAGRPFAGLTGFAMHVAVYGGRTFSADYPGHLQAALRKTFGPDFVSVFAEGAAGDVNQVNVTTADKDLSPEEIGGRLATAFVMAKRAPVAAKLAVRTGTVRAPLRDDRPDDLEVSRDRLVGPRSKSAEFLEQVEAYRVLLVHHMRTESGPDRPLPVQAVRLGQDTAVVTLPHEVFVELGLEIARRSPFNHTLIVTIANEVDCYIPTKKAFAEGSYEVTNSPYKPGVGELLVQEAVRLLNELN